MAKMAKAGPVTIIVDYLERSVQDAELCGVSFIAFHQQTLGNNLDRLIGHDVGLALIKEAFDVVRFLHPKWYVFYGYELETDSVINWAPERTDIAISLYALRSQCSCHQDCGTMNK